MELDLFIRYLHFISIIGVAGALTAEHLLFKPEMARSEIKRIAKIDLIYGLFLILLIVAGLCLWFWVGKPAEFYSKNWVFHLKFTLVILMGIFSIPPTLFFMRNKKGAPDELVTLPKSLIMWIRIELLLLVIIPLLAVMMAQGIGYFGE